MLEHYLRLKKLVMVTKSHPCCMKMAFDSFGGVNAEFMVVCVEAEPSASNDVVRCAKLV